MTRSDPPPGDVGLSGPSPRNRRNALSRSVLYGLMALHVGGASATYLFGKAAAVGFDNPEVVTLFRAAGAAVICMVLTGTVIPKPRFSLREWGQLCGFGFLLVPVNQYCFIKGLQFTVPSHPALLYALTPLGVLLLDSLFKRSMPPLPKIIGVLLALCGVVLILRPWEGGVAFSRIRTGDFWILGAVLSWVIYTVAARAPCRQHDPRSVTAWSLILGALMMLPVAGSDLIELPLQTIPVEAWFSLGWLAVVTSVVMMLLWNVLLRDLSSVEVAVCTNAQPPTTALLTALLVSLGWLDRQQDLGLLFLSGMLLVLVGVIIVQFRRA